MAIVTALRQHFTTDPTIGKNGSISEEQRAVIAMEGLLSSKLLHAFSYSNNKWWEIAVLKHCSNSWNSGMKEKMERYRVNNKNKMRENTAGKLNFALRANRFSFSSIKSQCNWVNEIIVIKLSTAHCFRARNSRRIHPYIRICTI